MTPGALLRTGLINFGVTKLLGASLPGALVMGLGGILWIAGAGNIQPGWRRWVLGIFH